MGATEVAAGVDDDDGHVGRGRRQLGTLAPSGMAATLL
jgi:hypothetical protein